MDLKLRELLLNIAGEPRNAAFVASFQAMMRTRGLDRMRRIMEDNYCYNLSLEAYARMCGRSLSAFKRFPTAVQCATGPLVAGATLASPSCC
ncbi:MAG: hypothetical protein IPI41_12460 [Flavobacteriales bacterium]|nr:hypothetical protein [Flavobacteriales bacterium]